MSNNAKERILLYLILVVALILFFIAYRAVKMYEDELISLNRQSIYICRCKAPEVGEKEAPKPVYKPVSKPKLEPKPKPQPAPAPKPVGPLPPNGPVYPLAPSPTPTIGPLPPNGPTVYNPPVTYQDPLPTYNLFPPSGPTIYESSPAPTGPLPPN